MDDQALFRIVALVAILFLILPAALPLARGRARTIRMAGVWVLAGGMLFALYRVFEWWLGASG